MMDEHSLKVTVLENGTFEAYYNNHRKMGNKLHECKPPRINASDKMITELLLTSRGLRTVLEQATV